MADLTFTIEFKDDGTPVLKNVQRAADEMGTGAANAAQRATGAFSGLQAKIITLNQAVELGKTAFHAIGAVLSTTVALIQQLTAAGAAQEAAEIKRNAALAAAGQLTQEYAAALNTQASAFQAITTAGDEVIIGLQAQLIAFGASRERIEELTAVTLDLAAGMGTDLSSAALLMGKAIAGEFATLSRYGIFVSDNAPKSEKLAQAIEQINQRFSGQAQAQAQSYAGRIAQLANAWGDLQEELGLAITQQQAVRNVLGSVKERIEDLTRFVTENREAISKWISAGLLTAIDLLGGLATAAAGTGKALALLNFAVQVLANPAQLANILRAWDDVERRFELVDAAIAKLNPALAALRTRAEEGANAGPALTTGLKNVEGALRKTAAAADEAAKKIAEARTALLAEMAVLQEVAAGTLTLSEAERLLAIRQLAVTVGSEELAARYLDLKASAVAQQKATEAQTEAFARQVEKLQEVDKAILDAQRGYDDSLASVRAQEEAFRRVIAAGGKYEAALRAAEEANVRLRAEQSLLAGKTEEEAAALRESARLLGDQAVELHRAQAAYNTYTTGVQQAEEATRRLGTIDLSAWIDRISEGLLQGTQSIKNIFKDLGQASLVQFAKTFLIGKRDKFDIPFGANVLGLVGNNGLIGSLFGQGGSSAASLFGGNFLGGLNGVIRGLPGIGSLFTAGIDKFALGLGNAAFNGVTALFSGGFGQALGAGLQNFILGAFDPVTLAIALAISLPSIIALFNKPGRIEIEKREAEKFFEKVFTGLNFKRLKEPQVAAGFAAFPDLDAATQSLGALFAKGMGDKATQGAIIRFAGQFLGNLNKMGLSAEETKQKVLELAQAMGFDLLKSVGEINTLTTTYSKTQKNNLLSLAEFEEEVAEARRNLAQYGDTTLLTARQLSELAIAHGNTGSKIVTLIELYAGALDLATGLTDHTKALTTAQKLLAEEFIATAKESGLFNAEIEALAEKVQKGDLALEEAVLAYNQLRVAAGLAALDLKDFTLDPEKLKKEVETLQATAATLAGIKQLAADALRGGAKEVLTGEEVAANFKRDITSQLRDAVVEGFTQGFLKSALAAPALAETLLEIQGLIKDFIEGTLSEEEFGEKLGTAVAEAQPLIEKMAKALGIASEQLRAILEAAGLLPEQIEEATAEVSKFARALEGIPEQVGATISRALVEALQSADFDASKLDLGTLEATIKQTVGAAVLNAVIENLVQGFVIAPMQAALAPIIAGITGGAATAGATVAAGGASAGAAIAAGSAAGAAVLAAATEGLQLLIAVMQTPEFKAFFDEIRALTGAPGGVVAGGFAGAGGAGGGGGGQTVADRQAENLNQLIEAINRFVDSLGKINDPVQALIDQFSELLRLAAEADPGGAARSLGIQQQVLARLRQELLEAEAQGAFGIALQLANSIANVEREIARLESIVAALGRARAALKQGIENLVVGFETGGERQENPLKKIVDEFKVLFHGITANLDTLRDAGVEVEALLARLTTALGNRLTGAVADLVGKFDNLIPASDKLADHLATIRDQFGGATTALQEALDTLLAAGLLTPELEAQIRAQLARLLGALPDALRAAAEKFLEPVQAFIDRGQPQVDEIQGLFNEFDKLRQKVLDNAVALAEAGIDVDQVLTDLSDSLRVQLVQALEDLTRDFIAKGQPQVDAIQSLLNEYDRARTAVLAHADVLRAAGIDVDKVLTDLSGSLKNQLLAVIKDMTGAFIERGLGSPGAIASLFTEFSDLRQQILDHADVLRAAGVDVDSVLTQLTDSLVAQLAKMRTELLDPITAAIERISPADLRPLTDIMDDIAGAGTLEDLARIRDAAISNIEERLRREQEAARKATDENIKLINLQKDEELGRLRTLQQAEEERLRAVQQAQEETLRSQMSALDRLISLREKQLDEEIRAVEDLARGVTDLRKQAEELRRIAEEFLLTSESFLTPRQRFFEAQRRFAEAVTPQTFQDLVRETRAVFASSEAGQQIIEAALARLRLTAGELESQADLQESQFRTQKESLEALQGIEDSSQEIARLTGELGLTGGESVEELRGMRSGLDSQLRSLQESFRQQQESLRQTFEQRTREASAVFEAAIAREQATLETKLTNLQDAAISELTILRDALSSRFDELIRVQSFSFFATIDRLNEANRIGLETFFLIADRLRLFPMQHGGIVTRPTATLLAEAGTPEMVIPLSRSGEFLRGDDSELIREVRLLREEIVGLRRQQAEQGSRPPGNVLLDGVKVGQLLMPQVQRALRSEQLSVPVSAVTQRRR